MFNDTSALMEQYIERRLMLNVASDTELPQQRCVQDDMGFQHIAAAFEERYRAPGNAQAR